MSKRSLPPGIRKRAGRWHYRFQVAGVEYAGSTGYAATARNLPLAMKKMAEARLRVDAGEESVGRLSPRPFSDAAALFRDWARGEYAEHPNTARRLAVSMASLRAFFGSTPIHGITAGAIEDYKAWRRAAGIREITLRHDLHALSVLFQYAVKQQWARRNPVREVEIPSDAAAVRQHVLTAAEEAAYFWAAEAFDPLHDIARLILWQGLRPDEAMALEWRHVDTASRTLTVASGKTPAARRTLRLTPEAAAMLAARPRRGRWVFPARSASGRTQSVAKQHDAALAASGTSFVLYDLRHTFATRMAERGCPIPLLAAILGHANLRTIHRYVHPSSIAMADAMDQYGAVSGFCPASAANPGNPEGRRRLVTATPRRS